MKTLKTLAIVLSIVAGMAGIALAGDDQPVTVAGDIMCAKCMLTKADASACQDVLVTADKAEYYLVKNAVSEKYGHACKTGKPAVATGTVTEKDGKKWLEATKIEEPKKG